MIRSLFLALLLAALFTAHAVAQTSDVPFDARTARSGKWSDPATWADRRAPKAGDRVQVRPGHTVVYDVDSDTALRMVHVGGTLSFARDRNTRLDVGLLKIQPGETAAEDGFACDLHAGPIAPDPKFPQPALEIGTAEKPIPAGVTAKIRLTYFPGMDRETLPAIVDCAGRWDVHGAPMSRTWVELGASVKPGDTRVTLSEPVTGWKAGDMVILTGSRHVYTGHSFRRGADGKTYGQTEERRITAIDGNVLTLDAPAKFEHFGEGKYRSEVANLSRNVVIESADPKGIRGHTMYHLNSTGGVSYAEFRHLGKENVLGKYSLHFHLVRDSMRGSGVLGASIWDSHNRWITLHGTDYLLVRDCVGYQSVGHGYFLEDGTEQYNVLDRNLAVQACAGKRLPKQVIPLDPNDGAGFWWANGRNTFTRNVACENDNYGYHFEIGKRSNFDPELLLRMPDGSKQKRDIRTIPFLRFEDNESHTEGLYSFNFGDDENPAVRGDRARPFIARNLTAWQTHYSLRPNLQFFLMDGFDAKDAVYGVYYPDYDAHVYRNIRLDSVNSEPINRGHDDDSIQYGDFTYDGLTIANCRIGRDPLIQMACTSPTEGRKGHFRNLTLENSRSNEANVVDLGGGPRNEKLENPIAYFFHDYPTAGKTTRVVSRKFQTQEGYRAISGFTGKDVCAGEVDPVPFPTLLEPVDDLPPASLVTRIERVKGQLVVRGLTQDNGELASVMVNGRPASLKAINSGVADWEVSVPVSKNGALEVIAKDRSGNSEKSAVRTTR